MDNQVICRTAYQISTPVLFLVFNRIGLTKRTFEAIRAARPQKLYFASDGPRQTYCGEKEKVDSIREFVLARIDWECEIRTLFREQNLGCKRAVSSAISWLFENEDQGIIIEDDCVPSFSFFVFCQELLEKFKNNKKIMHISGNFYLDDIVNIKASYYLSTLNGVWGWATWKRAWDHYDPSMEGYIEAKDSGLISRYFGNNEINCWMTQYLDDVYFDQDGSNWDPVWSYAIITNNGLCISPSVNLVENVGFTGNSATHGSSNSFLKYGLFNKRELDSISHPDIMTYNKEIDEIHFQKIIKSTDPMFLDGGFRGTLKKIFALDWCSYHVRRLFRNIIN
jgi:hypothetical protein